MRHPTQSDFSRRLGPVFAEYAEFHATPAPIPRMEDHKEAYRKAAAEAAAKQWHFPPAPTSRIAGAK